MQSLLLISCITLWFCIFIDAEPEDLFSFDSSDELTEPVRNEDFISFQSLNDPSSNDISPSDLASTLATSTSEYDADPYNLEVSNLFPEENLSVDTDSFLQSASACETGGRLSWVDDNAPNLQGRDDASCTQSQPQESIDSITNLFQDPESSLLQNIPTKKAPTGQTNQLGQDNENFGLDTLLNNRPVPLLFEEDGKKCPIVEFGLSITPVCLDSLKGSAIGSPGTGFTLHDVEPCKSHFYDTIVPDVLVRQEVNASTDVLNAPCAEGAELWCCREIMSEVNIASYQNSIRVDKYLIILFSH